MKHNILFMSLLLLFTINSGSSAHLNRFWNSPIGPYRMVFKQVYQCNPTQDNKIKHNMYISHKANSTFLFGNSTFKIPFDDTFFLEIKMSLKDSFGSWKENVYTHITPKACSSFKKLMGNIWTAFTLANGLQDNTCPILPGVYKGTGFDMVLFEKANFPKTFIYGTYKFHMYYSKKNEIFGCQVFIVDLVRP